MAGSGETIKVIFQFKWPWFLLLLPLVSMWVYWYWQPLKPAVRFRGQVTVETVDKGFGVWYPIFALCLMSLALARPQWGEWHTDKTQVRNLMLALDVSGSMRTPMRLANGIQQSRLDVLKQQVREFLKSLNFERVGVVVFADHALTLSPLTTDLILISQMLDTIESGMVGEKTAIDAAILLAVTRLKKQPNENTNKAIILFTDGIQTASMFNLNKAFETAKAAKIRVYTVMTSNAVRQSSDVFASLAQSTGGENFLVDHANDLGLVLMAIQTLEKTSLKGKASIYWKEMYALPFLMGLLILFGYEIQRKIV